MTEKIGARELSLMLAEEIEAVVRDLAIDVQRQDRRKLYAFAPWAHHHKAKLEIETHPRPGKWNDWVGGFYGDALDLVAATLAGQGDARSREARRAAVAWARDRYGVGGRAFDQAAWARRKAEAEARAKSREAQAARELAEARRTMFSVWLHASTPLRPSRPGVRGCDGARYLEARGIDFAQLGRLPRAVRFSPNQTWRGFDGERHEGPALVSAMTLDNGAFGSAHRIWIDPARPGEKADLDPPRKMYPSSEGAAIRLWRGRTGLSEAEAAAKGVREAVVVCEGVEDGLSIAMLAPELRVHAAGSLPGLFSYVPPRCAAEVIVSADNDWDKPQAQALLERSCARLAGEFERAVRVARSPEGKDFNDVLRGGA